MSGPDDWSHPEIVRNLKRLTEAVEKLVTEVASLHTQFIPRSEQRLRDQRVDERLAELGTRVLDVEADQERHRRDHATQEAERTEQSSTTWRFWVGMVAAAALTVVSSVATSLVVVALVGKT